MTLDVLDHRQRAYVEALMAGSSHAKAAEEAGISVRQAFRWRKEPAVKAALAELSDALLAQAADRCQGLALEALETTAAIMRNADVHANARLTAARIILDTAATLVEQRLLSERIAALEEQLHEYDRQEASRPREPDSAGPWARAGLSPAY